MSTKSTRDDLVQNQDFYKHFLKCVCKIPYNNPWNTETICKLSYLGLQGSQRNFIEQQSLLLLRMEPEGKQRSVKIDKKSRDWVVICIGYTLINEYGGRFISCMRGMSVELDTIDITVHLTKKINSLKVKYEIQLDVWVHQILIAFKQYQQHNLKLKETDFIKHTKTVRAVKKPYRVDSPKRQTVGRLSDLVANQERYFYFLKHICAVPFGDGWDCRFLQHQSELAYVVSPKQVIKDPDLDRIFCQMSFISDDRKVNVPALDFLIICVGFTLINDFGGRLIRYKNEVSVRLDRVRATVHISAKIKSQDMNADYFYNWIMEMRNALTLYQKKGFLYQRHEIDCLEWHDNYAE